MQITGEWYLCDDGVERPVIHGEIQCGDGSWEKASFLLDIGADRTVLSTDVLSVLQVPRITATDRLGGLGGLVRLVVVVTTMRFAHEGGGKVEFRGQFAAVTDPETLDMSVLGRDITDLFAVIVDRPGNVVCMLGQRHRYVILQD